MLFHFSEDPYIEQFVPKILAAHPEQPAMVWAIDEEHAPLYFFPRDCPRVAFWAEPTSSSEDINHFLAHTSARMVIVMEGRWLRKLQETKLFVYHLPGQTFQLFASGAGYYTSFEPVTPTLVEPVGDLLQRHIEASVEIRISPSLYPLHDELGSSTLHFSMIRMRNAARGGNNITLCFH